MDYFTEYAKIENPLNRANERTGREWNMPKIAGTLSAWVIDREAKLAVIKSELEELVKRNASLIEYRQKAMAIIATLE